MVRYGVSGFRICQSALRMRVIWNRQCHGQPHWGDLGVFSVARRDVSRARGAGRSVRDLQPCPTADRRVRKDTGGRDGADGEEAAGREMMVEASG